MNSSETTAHPTILICDDHAVVRSGLKKEIERLTNFQIIGEATTGNDAVEKAIRLHPDLVILDINMPGLNGIQVTEKLNDPKLIEEMSENEKPWPPLILILSAHSDPEYVYPLFANGAKGFLLKDEPPEVIINGMKHMFDGNPAISFPIQKILLRRRQDTQHTLSVRELEVLKLMAKGYTNEEIASKLFITTGTVKNHVTNIYNKLPDIRSRSEAVAWAWMNKIVKAGD